MDGMIEEVVTGAPLTVRVFTQQTRQLPDDVLASLEAVKAAQLAARERARRERWQAWAMVAGVAASVTFGVFVVRPRLHPGRAASAATAPTVNSAQASAAPAAQQRPALEQARPAAVPSSIGLLAAGVAELPAKAAALPAAIPAGNTDLDTCRDSYAGKRWRSAADACATAFASRPNDAKLALRVAEAQYARDHLPEAREWAQRTLALDAKQADALAILAHSEQRSGDAEAAARAFRRYLALAPRGWHSAEARAVLRGERAHAGAHAPSPVAPLPAAAPVAASTEVSADAPLRPTIEGAPAAPAAAPASAE